MTSIGRRFVINNEAHYHGHVKKSGQLSFSDINKSCVLIITGFRIFREKMGGVIEQRSIAVYPATI